LCPSIVTISSGVDVVWREVASSWVGAERSLSRVCSVLGGGAVRLAYDACMYSGMPCSGLC
jgi:hypothetical protein